MIELQDRIAVEASRTQLVRTLLLVFSLLFYSVGFGAAVAVFTCWFVIRWTVAATKVGWQDGRRAAPAYR